MILLNILTKFRSCCGKTKIFHDYYRKRKSYRSTQKKVERNFEPKENTQTFSNRDRMKQKDRGREKGITGITRLTLITRNPSLT